MDYASNACPECGMDQDEWGHDGQGYTIDGQTFCCQGCAEQTGCTCATLPFRMERADDVFEYEPRWRAIRPSVTDWLEE